MTALTTANPRSVLTHAVYLRRSPLVNGESTGWVFDPALRCEQISYRKGPNPGRAIIKPIVLPSGGSHRPTDLASIQLILANYACDYQVKVEVQPLDGEPVIAFEGVLMRAEVFAERLDAASDREDGTLIATAMPVLDNTLSDHLISGRWIVDATPAVWVIESPGVPAVFNVDGKPNMAPSNSTRITAAGLETLTALAFNFWGDNDSVGTWWTPREAIRTLLTFWLYGTTSGGGEALSRTCCVSGELMEILADTAGADDIWDARLPETNVHGLGVLDALHAVCRNAGLEMALMPDLRSEAEVDETEDRLYRLYIYPRNKGRLNTLKLQRRPLMDDITPEASLQQNDISRVRLLRDSLRTVSQVHARGLSLIEASFKLKPMWDPDDLAADSDSTDANQMQGDPDKSGLTYSARHVQGGADYDAYQHVGRLWGIDCTGDFSAHGYPEAAALYYHDPDGFDFVNYLLLDAANAIADERTALGITDAIAWCRRLRLPHPIRRPDGSLKGIDWVLEVSEDSGSSWTKIDLQFSVAREMFAIMLTGAEIANLAAVNAATFGTKAEPALADSWWTKILGKTLLFRLTCCIEADHAARYDATISAASGSAYERGKLLVSDIAEYWAAPGSINALTSASGYVKLNHRGIIAPTSAGVSYVTNLRHQAELMRSSWEQIPIAGIAATWVMDLGKWRLLDRITSIVGRDIQLGTNADTTSGGGGSGGGGGAAVAGMTIELNQAGQLITLELEDQRYTEGA
ncbi:MAG: hypothetical protein IT445_03065 [Phycisphaeraceae bacterium]|nr:hypothetical protein [Phycisphaeraceae bacterium]